VIAKNHTFAHGNGNVNHHLGTGFFLHERITSSVTRMDVISGRMSYITLRGRWYDIIILNLNAPTEDKSDDTKVSFDEELHRVLDQFPKYHMIILLEDFNAKVG